MDFTRDQVKQMLLEAQKPTMDMFAAEKKGRPIHGKVLEIPIGEEIHRFRYYEGRGENRALYVDIHGGGFTWGTMEDGDLFCVKMNEEFGLTAISPEYPLTPQEEYPTQLNWICDGISWFLDHAAEYQLDPDRIIVGGRSAGGNLAAAICIAMLQRKDFKVVLQILDHPWLDLCGMIDNSERYSGPEALSMEMLAGMAYGYADLPELSNPLISPLAAPDEILKELPPAVIQTCGKDSLRLDGDRYAARLKANGVPVIDHCVEDAIHGFTECMDEIGEEGRQWLVDAVKRSAVL